MGACAPFPVPSGEGWWGSRWGVLTSPLPPPPGDGSDPLEGPAWREHRREGDGAAGC